MKYSIHDGPGIRTTVFLKGCPLSCVWCHNPESQVFRPQLFFLENRCMGCMDCIDVCPEKAISLKDKELFTDLERCTACGKCVEVCPTTAREMMGRRMSVEETMREIEKDRLFYDQSGGGVTFSGGEPLSQPGFLKEVLKQCKNVEIHTTLDTCGFQETSILKELHGLVDLYLFDLKIMDDEKHRKFTGCSNEKILKNLTWLSEQGQRIWIRIPVIPGINDDPDNLKSTGHFLSGLPQYEQINLLPYHNISKEKYRRLQREYELDELPNLNKASLEPMAEILIQQGCHDVKWR